MPVNPGRLLGVDYGTKRVGLSLSDPLGVIARGAGTLENDGSIPDRIAEIVLNENVRLIVVGMPYAPDGGLGEKGREVVGFIEELRLRTPVPVTTWDESFTSVDAQGALRAAGMRKSRRKEKGRTDEMAARLLLQEYMDCTGTGGDAL
jgi:putative Holliday junction resolvase